MIKAAIYFALGCSTAAALLGNRTAWALAPAVTACLLADIYDVAFRPEYWLGLGATVMVLIVALNPRLERNDWLVLFLFPLAWLTFLTPDPFRYYGSNIITITQLMLTFNSAKVWERVRRTCRKTTDELDEFDFRSAHG